MTQTYPAGLRCYILTEPLRYRYSNGEKTFEQNALELVPANYLPLFEFTLRHHNLKVTQTPGLPDQLEPT